jgi:phage-related protein
VADAARITVQFFGRDRTLGKSFRDQMKAADTFGKKLDLVGQRMSNMGRTMTMGVTLPIVAGLGLATKAAMDEGKEMALLDKALRNNVQATDEQVAAVESWITATQNATGIADGELRPAFAALVAVTKDTGKAQDLMGTAMDIAAAKGKPVVTIAEALAKAQNGNIGILARYGVATKDATGKTLTFDEIMQNAAKTFGGSAAKAAETAAGKQAILKAKLADTAEEVGTSLIPMVEKGAEIIGNLAERFNKLSPGVKGFAVKAALAAAAVGPLLMVTGKFISIGGSMLKVAGNIGLAFGKNAASAPGYARALAGVAKSAGGLVTSIGQTIAALARQGAAMAVSAAKTLAATAATVAAKAVHIAAAAATGVLTAAQWLLNAAMSANPIGLVVIAIAALVGAFVLAWKKSETFRNIVLGAWNAIKAATTAIFGAIANFFKTWGPRILTILSGPIGIVARLVIKHWDSIKEGAQKAFGKVVEFARSLPGKIKSAVGNLGKLLWNAGADVLRGLWNGMTSIQGWIRDKIYGFFSNLLPGWAKKALGIGSPSKVFAEIGRHSAEGLVVGMDASRSLVALAAGRLAGAASGSASMSFAGAAGYGGGAGRSVVIASGAVQVRVDGSGLAPAQLTAAVRSGVDPALEALAREIGRL